MAVKVKGAPADAPGAGGAGGAGAGAAGKGKGENNKPCACSKSTSKENRDKVNEKDSDNKDPKCAVCGKTAKERQAMRLAAIDGAIARHDGSEAFVQEALKMKAYWSKPKMGRLQADHIYPAKAIKKDKNFQKLERTNLQKAREVITAQTNMRGLCPSCNAAKGGKEKAYGPVGTKAYKFIQDQTYFQKKAEIGQLISRGLGS